MKKNKLIKTIIIFFVIWILGILISLAIDIKNRLLPSLFLGAAIAIWYYK